MFPLHQPNGVGLSPDGDRVHVAETGSGRVWSWEVLGPGRVRRGAELLHGFSGARMLDSLAVDSAGNVCVATLNTGEISVLSPDGELVEQVPVPVPDPLVTNICFGGPDLRTAYITSSGRGVLYETEWPRPGLPPHFTA
ncbi:MULTISPECIES: SMP-30/gluconolactonase/LRE family protein [unclassified Saccharopolyspora]|uniref:SMP-30/gluconolactonase/LRE family protein n=1 Tax=unclassified Saccharopolyspora TaxID=2646250 RepID=UPI0027DF14BC|nr:MULTISPECIES: SMP-30/gluconolactonase/LRE family protein [unclassified Saccharopolyspora]